MYTINRFQTLIKPIHKNHFHSLVAAHDADKYSKKFRCYDLLIAMIYAQLTGADSLRVLEQSFNAHSNQHYHLNTTKIRRSTLSENLHKKSISPFLDIAQRLILHCKSHFKSEGQAILQLLDSSPIQLKGKGFEWCNDSEAFRTHGLKLHMLIDAKNACPAQFSLTASNVSDIREAKNFTIQSGVTYVFDKGYYDFEWWHGIAQAGANFVTRTKKNNAFSLIESKPISTENASLILEDNLIHFNKKDNPYAVKALRQIVVFREGKTPLYLVSNQLDAPAEAIANAYKTRWQIELFFKWLKQNLKIKRFLGSSENAVKLQLITAIITYLLLWLLHHVSSTTESLKMFIVKIATLAFASIENEKQQQRRKAKNRAYAKQKLLL